MRVVFALALLFALAACARQETETSNEVEATAESGVPRQGIDRAKAGGEAPTATFVDAAGKAVRIADFKGRPVLLNLWASWCAPCVKELPTLQKLDETQAQDGQLGVIAVSQDMAPKASVDAFLASKQISRFAAFHDPAMGLSSALGAEVLPTSILFDAQGREVWRYVGDLDWTSVEAAKLLAEARPSGAAAAR